MWENVPYLAFWVMATSAINYMFLLATPFDHTQLCHVLLQLCMLKLNAGKGCQFHI